jgi:O-antigen/teichoic acid export membrane protein
MPTSSNKRIAKNTLILYFRMIIILGMRLYTSRIILNTLGVEDYGIYNVVGGVVIMLSFLNTAMSSGTTRFLSFELGKADFIKMGRVFSMSMNIHAMIAMVIFILAETLGLWFLNTHLNIPAERMIAANWAYQFSILTFMVAVLSIPYHALIIAHERMNVYAYVSIVEVSLQLFIVFMLQWFGFDKLKLYSVLVFVVSLVIRSIYGLYSTKNFKESKYRFIWDKPLFRTLISFAGWNLWGNAAGVFSGQGVNMLLNIFFGPAINAARGIAYAVKAAVHNFAANFQQAMKPQIIKSYATNDLKYMHQLICQGAKYSFFLLFFLSLPILIETRIILQLWLKIVPEYTIIFTQLVIVNVLIDCFSETLQTAAHASGRIKYFQMVVGGLLLLILPFSWMFLKFGYPPQVTIIISILFSVAALIARLWILKNLIKLKVKDFVVNVVVKTTLVSLIALILPIIVHSSIEESIQRFVYVVLVSMFSTIITIYAFGLEPYERLFLTRVIKKRYANFTLLLDR